MNDSHVLICAATEIEANACHSGITGNNRAHSFEILKTGMGLDRAARSLMTRLKTPELKRPTHIVSTGFAGSADSTLSPGKWMLGQSVQNDEGDVIILSSNLAQVLEKTPLDWTWREFVSSREVVALDKYKNQNDESSYHLSIKDVAAIDMESYQLARIADRFKIKFDILRIVSDSPIEPIPKCISFLVQGAIQKKIIQQTQYTLQGIAFALLEPKKLVHFIGRGRKLPPLLEEGWRCLARQWN